MSSSGTVVLKVWPRNPWGSLRSLWWSARSSYSYNQTKMLFAFSRTLSQQIKIRSRQKNPVVFNYVR